MNGLFYCGVSLLSLAAVCVVYLYSAGFSISEFYFGGAVESRCALRGKLPSHTIPKIVHSVWMANPLKPYVLASIDSVIHFMPDVTYKLHILTPAGSNSTVLSAIRTRFERQLEPLLSEAPHFDLQIVLHDDVPSELKGTPLENKGITQEHMGGTLDRLLSPPRRSGDREGSPHGDHLMAMIHASDMYRVLALYKEGGIYMDSDHIMLSDVWPLFDAMGAFVVCETQMDARDDGRCKLCNGFTGSPPGHVFLKDALQRVADLIDNFWVNGLFPIRRRGKGEPPHVWFTAVGPNLLTRVKDSWSKDRKDVWVVSAGYPHEHTVRQLRRRPKTGVGKKKQIGGFPEETSAETSITVIGRRYFIPTFWQDLTLNGSVTPRTAGMYSRAYSFHLWEMGRTGGGNKIRPRFVKIIRDSPNTVLAYLFRKFCLILCEAEKLERPVESLQDVISSNQTISSF